jgi:hypothetical protein
MTTMAKNAEIVRTCKKRFLDAFYAVFRTIHMCYVEMFAFEVFHLKDKTVLCRLIITDKAEDVPLSFVQNVRRISRNLGALSLQMADRNKFSKSRLISDFLCSNSVHKGVGIEFKRKHMFLCTTVRLLKIKGVRHVESLFPILEKSLFKPTTDLQILEDAFLFLGEEGTDVHEFAREVHKHVFMSRPDLYTSVLDEVEAAHALVRISS